MNVAMADLIILHCLSWFCSVQADSSCHLISEVFDLLHLDAGAVLGGLMIGFIEIVIVALFPALSGYRDAFAFIVLIVVLLVKPTGLLGEKTTEKV